MILDVVQLTVCLGVCFGVAMAHFEACLLIIKVVVLVVVMVVAVISMVIIVVGTRPCITIAVFMSYITGSRFKQRLCILTEKNR